MRRKNESRDFEFYIEEYLCYCQSRRLRPKTISSYDQALRLFARWAKEQEQLNRPEEVREQTMRRYICDLQDRGKYTFCVNDERQNTNCPTRRRDYRQPVSITTINNYIRNLRAFFNWFGEEPGITYNPMKKIRQLKTERQPRAYLEDHEVQKLLSGFDRSYFSECRDAAVIQLLLDTGMRLGECLQLHTSHLDMNERVIEIPAELTKGRKTRCVYFSTKTARVLQRWLNYKDRYIWNFFDFIILDEAHSIVTDAAFCDSPFHVKQFLLQAYRSATNCKVVLMTGTPEPIDWLVSDKTKVSEGFNQLNFYDDCIHVDPEEVLLYPYHLVVGELVDELNKGKGRIIYFANSIKRIKAVVSELQASGIPEADIGITYSNREKDADFPPTLTEKMDRIRDSIVQNGSIPEDIKILITTAQNREGVNIHDKDIKIMVAESTTRSELVQMAGRVRSGLDLLVAVYGGASCGNSDTKRLEQELNKECVKSVNATFDDFYRTTSSWGDLILFVENKFTYIRFDYFSLEFKFYAGKARGDQQAHRDGEELDWYLKRAERGVWAEKLYRTASNASLMFALTQRGRETNKIVDNRLAEVEEMKKLKAQEETKKYWDEHAEEKAALEHERTSLRQQLENLESQFKAIPERTTAEELVSKINALSAERGELGLFKIKERRALQEQIEAVDTELSGVQERVRKAEAEISEKMVPIRTRILEIDATLSSAPQ